MKSILSFILFSFYLTSYSQDWYSKFFDPFNGKHEAASIMHVSGDTLLLRAGAPCLSNEIACTVIGKYLISKKEFIEIKHYDDIQLGAKNLLVTSDNLFLSSQEDILNENISVSQVDEGTLNHIQTIDLKIDDDRYSSYTIKKSIIFQDRLIIGGQALDLENFIGYQGWYNYQENALLFVLDSLLNLDTIIITPPSSGAFLKIEDMALGPDSILYISFYEKYLKSGSSQDYLQDRNVIYGFDKKFKKIFEWIGHDYSQHHESQSNLVIGNDTSIYINYSKSYYTYLASLNVNGATNWECLLDSTIGENLYVINNLKITKNEDIIGAGTIYSPINKLGSGFLFRIDSRGNLKWKHAIRVNKGFDPTFPADFPFESVFEDLSELPNGDLIATGWVIKFIGFDEPTGPHNYDIWMVQVNEEGCLWNDCPYVQDIIIKDRYIPIVYPGNEWVVDAISPSLPTTIHRYSFSLDSVILNDKYYYELVYKMTLQGPWEETGRFMREENGKVFEYSDIDSLETLLYDLNLQIGDTLLAHVDGSINHRRVIKVEGIKTFDEVQRKSITLECTSDSAAEDTTIWIEGIGDVERLFWTSTFCSTNDREDSIAAIRCFLTLDQVYYANPGLVGDCYITSVDEFDYREVKVFPNPGSDVLHFIVDDHQAIDRVFLYNSLGLMVHSTNNLSSNDPMDISNVPPGIYYGMIYFANDKIGSFKIVITN